MCLIELKGSPKPVVSCAMSAKSCLNNAEVFTNSPLVKKARENILEFLLLNHPLDCPICDQGGECDLQDQSFFFGLSKKRFYSFKRVVTDKNIGPIVKTVMTRCIHCTRCVRFAGEVAGVDDLGMFGRGMNSEIGTYVTKIFQSELSGNVIDLCPVGALTSKPYPFLGRNWELKTVNSIDYSDGFGSNLQVCLKNNKIVKILPSYNSNDNSVTWISDKTRFAFDGMFSPERISQGFVTNSQTKSLTALSWKNLFDEIVHVLYFQDHLSRHFLKVSSLLIVFNSNISNEALSLLVLLTKKYPFMQLRKAETTQINNDLETNFLTNSATNKLRLSKSNLSFLVGVNTRYEGSFLNLKLRQRYLKGNFKAISLGTAMDLTFPVSYLGLNIKTLLSVVEGNNFFCQELANSHNPLIICSSELFARKDASTVFKLLKLLKTYLKKSNGDWESLNILNSSVNDGGVNYLNTFKTLTEHDVAASTGIYFIETSPNIANLQKIIQFQLLNYFQNESNNGRFLIEQNNNIVSPYYENVKSTHNICSYINLPNNVFFETSGTYVNTEGIIRKTIKFIPSLKQSKETWQIIRKLTSCSSSLSFMSDLKTNNRISFNCNNIFNFKNFTNFQYYAIKNLTNVDLNNNVQTKNLGVNLDKYKVKRSKLFATKLRLWLDDFYIGGKDLYSKHSITMIKCSQLFRLQQTNFNHII